MITPFNRYSRHTYSYMTLRKAVGWIGLLLPFVLMLGGYFIFKGKFVESSISYYYHTGMRDVFVGALCAVALFLFFTVDTTNGMTGQETWVDYLRSG